MRFFVNTGGRMIVSAFRPNRFSGSVGCVLVSAALLISVPGLIDAGAVVRDSASAPK